MAEPEAKVQSARLSALAATLDREEGVDLLAAARLIFADDLADPVAVDAAIAARDAAIDRLSERTSFAFKVGTLASIEAIALLRDEFTTDAVWALNAKSGVPEPHDNRAMAVPIKRAAEAGWITPTDRFVPSNRPEHHRGPIRVWRSCIKGAQAA